MTYCIIMGGKQVGVSDGVVRHAVLYRSKVPANVFGSGNLVIGRSDNSIDAIVNALGTPSGALANENEWVVEQFERFCEKHGGKGGYCELKGTEGANR